MKRIVLFISVCFFVISCKKPEPIEPVIPIVSPDTNSANSSTYSGYFYGDNKTFEPIANRTVQLAIEGSFSQDRTVVAETTTDDKGYFQFKYDNSSSWKVVDFDLVDNGKDAGYKTVITNIPLNKAVYDTLYVQAITQVDVYLDESYESTSDSIFIYIWKDDYRAFSVAEYRGKKLYSNQGRLQQEYKKQYSNEILYSDTAYIRTNTNHKSKTYMSGVLPNISKVYLD